MSRYLVSVPALPKSFRARTDFRKVGLRKIGAFESDRTSNDDVRCDASYDDRNDRRGGAYCDVGGAIPASTLIVWLRQSFGNSPVQALKLRPAHLYCDIVVAHGWVGNEVQLDRILFQDQGAAYRFVG